MASKGKAPPKVVKEVFFKLTKPNNTQLKLLSYPNLGIGFTLRHKYNDKITCEVDSYKKVYERSLKDFSESRILNTSLYYGRLNYNGEKDNKITRLDNINDYYIETLEGKGRINGNLYDNKAIHDLVNKKRELMSKRKQILKQLNGEESKD